ncbi:MAG: hypothetical protein ACI4I6_06345 [Hominimerdicola sp.]
MRTNVSDGKLYKPAFFAFLMGTVLMGILLGTVSYCYMSGEFLEKLSLSQTSFIEGREQLSYGAILVKSFSTTTGFMSAVFLLGFCPIGQPLEFAVLLIRGMGLGVTLAQLYSTFGKQGIVYGLALVVPGAVFSSIAMVVGVRESIGLSNIYMRVSLSDRQVDGLLDSIKLYGTKFLVLEAVLAVSAGVDCIGAIVIQNIEIFS